jgi:hypothetical protein
MALDGAGSRRAWGYALNGSRFPGARTGGEEIETVCASNARRYAELETVLLIATSSRHSSTKSIDQIDPMTGHQVSK